MENRSFDLAISQNYDIGLLLQREILKTGFSIPQRIRHIFLNEVNFYEMDYPSISGIDIPYDQMGEYAAKLLLAMIETVNLNLPTRNSSAASFREKRRCDAVKILRLIKIKKRTPANSSL